MKCGFSQREITPKSPVYLGGYAAVRKMETVHDPLFVKVALFEINKKLYGIACYDLIAIDHLIKDKVIKLYTDANIPIESFYFHAIHTHSGPMGVLDTNSGFLKCTIELMGKTDENLIDFICDKTLDSIKEAYALLDEGTLHIQYGSCVGVGANRVSRDLQGNNSLFLLEARTTKQSVLFTNFACHPTVLSVNNLQCSADYPGAYAKKIETLGYDISFFINGCCGDISTRFTRRDSGFIEVERLASLLASATEKLLTNLKDFSIEAMDQKRIKIALKAKKPIAIETAEENVEKCRKELNDLKQSANYTSSELRMAENVLEGAESNLRYSKEYDGTFEYHAELSMWRWNDEIFITIPGELFSELSNLNQDEHIHYFCYMNGYLMYFADEKAYENNVYEALSSPFEKGESEKMMAMITKQIDIWRKK